MAHDDPFRLTMFVFIFPNRPLPPLATCGRPCRAADIMREEGLLMLVSLWLAFVRPACDNAGDLSRRMVLGGVSDRNE